MPPEYQYAKYKVVPLYDGMYKCEYYFNGELDKSVRGTGERGYKIFEDEEAAKRSGRHYVLLKRREYAKHD